MRANIQPRWLQWLLTQYAAPPQSDGPNAGECVAELRKLVADIVAPRVLELGTLRSIESRSTMHRDLVPHASEFLGTDIKSGPDVDIVADVHRLTDTVGSESFDVIVSFSTFEHLKYPHVAAHEIMKALREGGPSMHTDTPIFSTPCLPV